MTDVVTGEAVVLDVRTARLPSRVLGLFLDLLVQGALLAGIGVLTARISRVVDPALTATTSLVLYVLVIVGYPATLESLWEGRTLGKAALGLRVVSEDGGPERFRQALFRALTGFVEIWLTLGIVALVTSLLSRHGKRLGDVFAGTVAVRERMPVRGGELAVMPPQLATWAAGLELSGLSDDVALTARQFLSRYRELAPQSREEMARRIASAMAERVSPGPPAGTPATAYLSAVLAERRRREEMRLVAQQPRGYAPQFGPAVAQPQGAGAAQPHGAGAAQPPQQSGAEAPQPPKPYRPGAPQAPVLQATQTPPPAARQEQEDPPTPGGHVPGEDRDRPPGGFVPPS